MKGKDKGYWIKNIDEKKKYFSSKPIWILRYEGLNIFPVWLRNRLLSAGLEPVLSQTENVFTLYGKSVIRLAIEITLLIFSFHPPKFYLFSYLPYNE